MIEKEIKLAMRKKEIKLAMAQARAESSRARADLALARVSEEQLKTKKDNLTSRILKGKLGYKKVLKKSPRGTIALSNREPAEYKKRFFTHPIKDGGLY